MVDIAYKPIEKVKQVYPGGTLTPPKFMPTYYEWLSKLGNQLLFSTFSTVDIELYEVPDGYRFYLTNISMSGTLGGGGGNVTGAISIIDSGAPTIRGFLLSIDYNGANGNGQNSINLSPPFVVNAKQRIKSYVTGATINHSVMITGFLVKINDIPYF